MPRKLFLLTLPASCLVRIQCDQSRLNSSSIFFVSGTRSCSMGRSLSTAWLCAQRKNKPHRRRRPEVERLEDRLAPSVATTFVNENWNLIADNGTVGVLDAGDVVRNDNDTISPATVTATLGTNGFGTVTTSSVGPVTGVPGSVSGA